MRNGFVDGSPLTDEGDAALQTARSERKVMTCLTARCHESKAAFAHATPVKGDDGAHYVADLVASHVSFMGHIKLLIKTDNGPALRKLASVALERVRCQIVRTDSVVESIASESAEYEGASNGGTECGIRAVRGLCRTIKRCTEKRICQEVPATHPLPAWLLEHVCLILNARMVGEDGTTVWTRFRGPGSGQRLTGFLGSVFYKQPPNGPQRDVNGNMAARMFPGIFLGYRHTFNCYMVATADGNVINIRSVLRRPFADRWCAESIKSIKATPWSLRAITAPDVIELGRPVEKPVGVEDDNVPMPRRLKITARILETYGTTDGCAQCGHIRAFR